MILVAREFICEIPGTNHRLPYRQEHFKHEVLDTTHILPEKNQSMHHRSVPVENALTGHVNITFRDVIFTIIQIQPKELF